MAGTEDDPATESPQEGLEEQDLKAMFMSMMKEFNQHVEYHHFKMDTLETAINMMKPGCFMASIDLKDAYYSVPICIAHQKYLKFVFNTKLYQFTCMPNGLSSAPRIFTKLLKPVYETLHNMGYLNLGYIDDSYLQGDTQ